MDFIAFGMLHNPGSEVSKKASNLWFKTGHWCIETAESDQIYEPQLEAPFRPVTVSTAIWYPGNALRGFRHVWADFVRQRSQRRHKTMFSKNDPIIKLKWLNGSLGSDGLISLPSLLTGISQQNTITVISIPQHTDRNKRRKWGEKINLATHVDRNSRAATGRRKCRVSGGRKKERQREEG